MFEIIASGDMMPALAPVYPEASHFGVFKCHGMQVVVFFSRSGEPVAIPQGWASCRADFRRIFQGHRNDQT